MIHKFLLLAALSLCTTGGFSQQIIPLYAGDIPNSKPVPNEEVRTAHRDVDTIAEKVSIPTLSVFLPGKGTFPLKGTPPGKSNANRTAVIICPGGGYHALLVNWEGSKVAEAFRQQGIAAFVLKYRLPSDRTMVDKTIGPLQDAQEAIKTVRERAAEWGIDPNKVGIMGFSAGGHLAASAGTHFDDVLIENKRGTSLRPDFMILIYPVISFTDSIGHIGSRNNLLGPTPSQDQIRFYSNELQVNSHTPPAFLAQAVGDVVVSSRNSLSFYQALHENNVPAELHLYEKGEHGFLTAPPFEEWFGRCLYWLTEMGLR